MWNPTYKHPPQQRTSKVPNRRGICCFRIKDLSGSAWQVRWFEYVEGAPGDTVKLATNATTRRALWRWRDLWWAATTGTGSRPALWPACSTTTTAATAKPAKVEDHDGMIVLRPDSKVEAAILKKPCKQHLLDSRRKLCLCKATCYEVEEEEDCLTATCSIAGSPSAASFSSSAPSSSG